MILPTKAGRKPDFAEPTSRPRLSVSMAFKLGRAEACVGASARLVGTPLVMLPDAPGLSHTLPAD
jgi:hypothetical protein